MFIILEVLAPLVGAILLSIVMTMPLALAATYIENTYFRLRSSKGFLRTALIVGSLSLIWLLCAYGIAWFAGSTLYHAISHNPKPV